MSTWRLTRTENYSTIRIDLHTSGDQLSSTGRDPNCSQTVPSRSWSVPCETFMRHYFLLRLDPVTLSSSKGVERARIFVDEMFHEQHCLGHGTFTVSGLGKPPVASCLTSNTDPDHLYAVFINSLHMLKDFAQMQQTHTTDLVLHFFLNPSHQFQYHSANGHEYPASPLHSRFERF